uniref:Uncharacterized protein n=1 Tax=Brassica campestris TaxID=3711 RepID=A0A3P5YG03_BRACM|nr:unnamed protein product [Brassica rapa]
MHDINNISNSIGTGGKYNEEGLGEHYRDKVSPCADPVINHFSHYQSKIPKSSSSKGVHDLLRRFKDTVKLRDKVTANGELIENPTTQDSLTISIKILTKAIKKLEKDRERERVIGNGYEEHMKHLDKKSEWIWRKCDEQKKSILELRKIHKDVCSKLQAQFIDDDKRQIRRTIYQ